MRTIRVAEPQDRVTATPPVRVVRRSRLLDWVLTLPIVLLVPALILISMPAAAAGPALKASPSAAAVGTKVVFRGSGFTRGTAGSFVLDDSEDAITSYRVTGRGQVRVAWVVPADTAPGTHTVSAVDATGVVASATLDVLGAAVPDPTEPPSPTPTPKPTPTPTPKPTATPASTPTPAPSATPPPSASATPSVAPSAAPSASPSATPAPTASATPAPAPALVPNGSILVDRTRLMALPMSGSAWSDLKARADLPAAAPDLSDQNDPNDVTALAKALVYARTGVTRYRDETIVMLKAAVGTEYPGDTLGIARGVAPLVLAADLIGWRDPAWMNWLRNLRTWANPDRGYTLISMHEKRPNNWGTHAGAGRIATDLYLGDSADLARAAAVFKGYLGDRASYASFTYGSDLSWQYSTTALVGINPTGATKSGMNVDGIIPDDMRRGGSFPSVGDLGQSYTWEALQGVVLQAELLSRAGYNAWAWQDKAVLRAFTRIHALGYPAAGDDEWQPWLVNRRYGTSFPAPTGTHPGKSFGYADWLYGS